MLQAKLNTGKLITLYRLAKSEIEWLRRKERFFCPTCSEEVIMKAGIRTIPHFAHQTNAACPANDGGEGSYHESGKLHLFSWLQDQGLSVTLEEYIPQIKQRPDIMLRLLGKQIAIEYQCASISIENMRERTEGYHSLGIIPIWVLGANRFKRSRSNLLRLDAFTLQFLHQFNHSLPPTLYFFDPQNAYFIQAKDLYLTRHNQAIAQLTIKRLNQMRFVDLFTPYSIPLNTLCLEWKKAKQHFRLYRPKKLYGKELAWHKWLYQKGLYRENLPSIVYLPVSSQFMMNREIWDWQSRICLDILDKIPIGGKLSLATCENELAHLQYYPLIRTSLNPISEYLQLLAHLNILSKQANNSFMKKNDIAYYHHIEAAMVGDVRIMDNFFKILSAKYEHDS